MTKTLYKHVFILSGIHGEPGVKRTKVRILDNSVLPKQVDWESRVNMLHSFDLTFLKAYAHIPWDQNSGKFFTALQNVDWTIWLTLSLNILQIEPVDSIVKTMIEHMTNTKEDPIHKLTLKKGNYEKNLRTTFISLQIVWHLDLLFPWQQ